MALVDIPTTGLWSTIAGQLNNNFTSNENRTFLVRSDNTIPVSSDDTAPSIMEGLFLLAPADGFTLDSAKGAIQNTSGKDTGGLAGTVSIQPAKSGGGAAQRLRIWAETSADGVTWNTVLNSLRAVDIPNDGETFKTIVAFIDNIPAGNYGRFRFFSTGGGTLTLTPETETINGENLSGPSIIWTLSEV